MSEFAAGPAGRIERVRTLMAERGYDAIVVRDEANLRWPRYKRYKTITGIMISGKNQIICSDSPPNRRNDNEPPKPVRISRLLTFIQSKS